MKLHALHIENLNSLRGTHTVQFETLFAASNILLIAGETGAGKSTLLDAIHLALFGKTPRLQDSARSTRSEETSVQHVMTRGTGECSATLEFSVLHDDGMRHRYQATWSLHRAHRKADGRVQDPKHNFARYDAATGRYVDMLQSGEFPSTAAARTHALRGMTEEDFLRAVLLPQGQFDALLTADEKTRAEALKRIVSVEHIQAIGAQVADRAREAKRALDDEQSRLGAQEEELLTDDARAHTQQELERTRTTIEQKSTEQKRLQERVDWADRYQELLRARSNAEQELTQAKQAALNANTDRQALKEHQRLQEPWQQWIRCKELQQDLLEQTREASALENTTKAKQKALDAATKSQRAAAENLQEEQRTQEAKKSTLDAAFAAWKYHQECDQTAKNATKDLDAANEAYAKEKKDLDERAKALENAKRTATELKKTLEEYAFSDAATAATTQIDALIQDHGSLYATYRASHAPVKEAKNRLQSITTQIKTLHETHQSIQREHSDWIARAIEVYEEVPWLEAPAKPDAQTLRLDDVDAWGQEVDAHRNTLKDYGVALRALFDKREEHDEAAAEFQRAEKAAKTAKIAWEKADKAFETQDERYRTQQELLTTHKELVLTQKRYLELVDELHNTDTCPVCGTHSPPQHADARRKDVEQHMAAAQQAVKQTTEALRAAETARNTAQKQRDAARETHTQAQTRYKDLTQRLARYKDACNEALQDLKESPLYQVFVPQDGLQELGAQLEELRDRLRGLNDAYKACKKLYGAGRDVLEKQNSYAREQESLKEQKHAADTALQDAEAAQNNSLEKLQAWTRRVRSALDTPDFVRWQLPVDDNIDDDTRALNKNLQNLRQTLTRYHDATQTYAQAQARVHDATQEHATQQKDADAAKRARDAAQERAEHAKQARDQAHQKVQQFFDGVDPRSVEKQWLETLETLRKALENHRKTLDEAQRAYDEAHRASSNAATLRDNTDAELKKQQQKLQTSLQAAEIPDVETLKVRRLSPERAEELDAALRAIDAAHARAQGAFESAKDACEQHLKRQEELGEASDEDASRLLELTQQISELHERRGRLNETLEKDAKRRESLQAAAQKLDALRREHHEWDLLRQLIGLNQGEAFARYALALSLGELIAHANEQLKIIAPRYTLKQRFDDDGVPQIDFEILDHDFTSDVRPISNLSGGERFQLSLAMALGLSSMSRSIMPIETLLIDEGFGTLDPIALDQAIQTLEGLYLRTGARVALISHVERLRERLPTQIIVRKRGGGHSKLEQYDGVHRDALDVPA